MGRLIREYRCHCEERSDEVTLGSHPVIARSAGDEAISADGGETLFRAPPRLPRHFVPRKDIKGRARNNIPCLAKTRRARDGTKGRVCNDKREICTHGFRGRRYRLI